MNGDINVTEFGNWSIYVMITAVSLLGGYVVASFILFKYPLLIHKKKRVKFRCKHISHRGGAGENLENTMTAFEHAVSVGTDMLEIDCQRTADGHVVVAHDDDLRRLTGHDARISETRLSDLPPIRRQLPVEFMSFKHTEGDDCRIPLLREVFERFRNLPMNIDIKVEDERLIRDVSQLVREFQREHITVWGNAKHTTIQKCHRENPNIPILFSFRRVVIITFSFYIGLLPFLPMKEQFLEIFLPSIFLKKDKEFFAMNKKWRLLLWFVDKLMVRRAIFEHLDRRGVHTYLWVLNDEADWLRAERLNVTGVMTDFPSKYTQFLSSNGFGQK